MPVVVLPPPRASYRRICSWCHGDMGPLVHPIDHDSYAICEPCQHRYFAYLYEAELPENTAAEVLRERAVGE